MNKHTIFWADDDPDDLEIFKNILAELTPIYEIQECRNGKDVLEKLDELEREEYPCLIILDLNMPVMDGKQTLIQLKHHKDYALIPVVVFTTSDSELDKLFCSHYYTEMITKPPKYEPLKRIIGKILDMCEH